MNTAEAGTDTKVQLVRSVVARQRRTERNEDVCRCKGAEPMILIAGKTRANGEAAGKV